MYKRIQFVESSDKHIFHNQVKQQYSRIYSDKISTRLPFAGNKNEK